MAKSRSKSIKNNIENIVNMSECLCVQPCIQVCKIVSLTLFEMRHDDLPNIVYVGKVNSPPGVLLSIRVAAGLMPPDGARVAVDCQHGATFWS